MTGDKTPEPKDLVLVIVKLITCAVITLSKVQGGQKGKPGGGGGGAIIFQTTYIGIIPVTIIHT